MKRIRNLYFEHKINGSINPKKASCPSTHSHVKSKWVGFLASFMSVHPLFSHSKKESKMCNGQKQKSFLVAFVR